MNAYNVKVKTPAGRWSVDVIAPSSAMAASFVLKQAGTMATVVVRPKQ